MMRQESGSRKISRNQQRCMQIMQRMKSRSSNRHTSRNITLSSMLSLLTCRNVLRTSRTKSLKAACRHYFVLRIGVLPSLKKVSPISHTWGPNLVHRIILVSDDDCRKAVYILNSYKLVRVASQGDGYDVSIILCTTLVDYGQTKRRYQG